MRMPNAYRCSEIEYARAPYTPSKARNNATAPNQLSIMAWKQSAVNESLT